MWLELSRWVKDVKIPVSRVNSHQKLTLAEGEFNNQVDRMIRSVESQPSPCPGNSIIVQWADKQSYLGGSNGDRHGLSLIKSDLITAATKFQICQVQTNTELQIWHIPLGDQTETWEQVAYIVSLSFRKDNTLSLLKEVLVPVFELSFLSLILLPKPKTTYIMLHPWSRYYTVLL